MLDPEPPLLGERARCASRAPKTPLPPSFPLEAAKTHPSWMHVFAPTAQCELDAGHGEGTVEHDVARRHCNGVLCWWDPVVLYIDGEPHVPSTEPFMLFGEPVS